MLHRNTVSAVYHEYHDLSENKDWYDFSDYPYDHTLHNQENKKVIRTFEDELNAVAHRSKTKML